MEIIRISEVGQFQQHLISTRRRNEGLDLGTLSTVLVDLVINHAAHKAVCKPDRAKPWQVSRWAKERARGSVGQYVVRDNATTKQHFKACRGLVWRIMRRDKQRLSENKLSSRENSEFVAQGDPVRFKCGGGFLTRYQYAESI